ncbi:MAG TPA: hypothetical protein VKE94_19415 [Gemmataceae bacterium]|nr:hypothetical protein [Gemmataceae bacterium]
MNALNNEEVGKYVNEYFVASFQKVATFKIVDGQKQGGNVATYFCAPDGRVLNVVAGPVDAATMLREAKWTVETAKKAIEESKGDGAKFKETIRKAHAQKLRDDFGIVVEPVTFDPPDEQDQNSALTYNDPTGRPLAPKLPPPPIDGPDVTLKDKQEAARSAAGAIALTAQRGGRVWVNNVGRAHQLMSAHSMAKIEKVYGTVFENILGERISTKPVEVTRPFSWVAKDGKRIQE